ncbi:MAG: D-glycero-beta-D-manno-heptose 1,7-bisphosphate 7-phosphatase [Phycisphaeraceae bacterium]
MKLVVLAGGRGTRMGDLARDLPKPMIPIAGKPILEHQLAIAKRHGIRDVVLLTGHMAEAIEHHFGDGSRLGLNITYSREEQPLGTAGAMKAIESHLTEDFLVFYGDTLFDLDLDALIAHHRAKKAIATLVVHPNDHPHDSDLVEVDGDDRITVMHRKPHPRDVYRRNLVSAALYVMSPKVLQSVTPDISSDFGRDIFPQLAREQAAIYAWNTPEYIKDVGTPHRLKEVERDLINGKVARMNRRHARPAIFLDRDGVINEDHPDMVRTPDDFHLLPGVAEAVKKINKSDYVAVLVTNQPMIAKGFASEADLDAIHAKLDTLLGERGAYLDRIYYCPHHPEAGFEGERIELKIECDCRKPKAGMLTRAAKEMNIDLSRSAIVGDRSVDIEAGRRAGVRTVLVRTGQAGGDGKINVQPDDVADDLAQAVDLILSSAVSSTGAR